MLNFGEQPWGTMKALKIGDLVLSAQPFASCRGTKYTKVSVKGMAIDLKHMLLQAVRLQWSVTAYTKKMLVKGSTALYKDAHCYAKPKQLKAFMHCC